MSNTINVNYMTRSYDALSAGYAAKNTAKEETFTDKVEEKRAEAVDAAKIKEAEAVAKREMTLEEYKQYIHNEISRMPLHPSQLSSSISVHISEEGFKAMQEDPEYEKWVLDTLRQDFAFNDPWAGMCGGHYTVHYFGATKEEYHGHSWYPEYQNGNGSKLYNEKSKGSFWQRRTENRRQAERQYEKELEKKARDRKLAHERAQKRYYEQMLSNRAYDSRMRQTGSIEKQLQAASGAYDSNVVTLTGTDIIDFEELL